MTYQQQIDKLYLELDALRQEQNEAWEKYTVAINGISRLIDKLQAQALAATLPEQE